MVAADCQPTSASLVRPMFLLEVLVEKRASHAAASDVHRTAPNATAKPGVAIANARRLTLGEQNVENTEDCNAPAQPPRFPRLGHSGLGSRGSRYLAEHFSRRADKRANQHANHQVGTTLQAPGPLRPGRRATW